MFDYVIASNGGSMHILRSGIVASMSGIIAFISAHLVGIFTILNYYISTIISTESLSCLSSLSLSLIIDVLISFSANEDTGY